METSRIFNFLRAKELIIDVIPMVIAGMSVACESYGQDGYLKIVGPPAIRFEAKSTNELRLAKNLALSLSKPTAAAAADPVRIVPDSTATNSVDVSHSSTSTNSIPQELPATTESKILSVSGGSVEPDAASGSAGELLMTMPQMIMQYLKPDSGNENWNPTNRPAATIFVPTWMGFMPNVMQFPAENKTESRATYISQ